MEKHNQIWTSFYSLCYRKLVHKAVFHLRISQESAEDLVQEAVLKSMHTYNNMGIEAQKAYVWQKVKWLFIDECKKTKRKIQALKQIQNEKSVDLCTPEALLSEANLHSLIDKIKEPSKTIMVMRTQGYQYDEIALALDIPIGTIKSRIHGLKKKYELLLQAAKA